MLRTIHTTEGHTIHAIVVKDGRILPHSLTGPAFIYPDNTKEYYIYGLKYNKQAWQSIVRPKKDKAEDLLELE